MTFTIDRFRSEDRAFIDEMYVRVFGHDSAEAFRRRWEWMYLRNPNLPGGTPLIWVARDGDEVVGQYATMPVRLSVRGVEIDGAWGMDVMVSPDRQRTGLGRVLFQKWDDNTGAAIGLGLTDASHALFTKMQWGDLGRVPRLVRMLPARRLARLALRVRPLRGHVDELTRFDERFTCLYEGVAKKFAFVVRRDAAYLNWKFTDAPHLRYTIAALVENSEVRGYAVVRHARQAEDDRRITFLVDFLADPDDPGALPPLLRWVDRQAVAAGSEVIRVVTTHDAFITTLKGFGYQTRDPSIRLVAKINGVPVPAGFYDSSRRWHITFGDSDVDR